MARQRDGQLVAKAAHPQRRQLRRTLTDRYLSQLASVAEQAAKEEPGPFVAFRVPAGTTSHLVFASAVRSMLTAATEGSELLAKHALSETLLKDLDQAVTEVDELNATVLEAKRGHVGATTELGQVAADLVELVGVLDGIYRYAFADSPQILGAWNSARHVVNPVRAKAVPPPAEGGIDKAA